MSLRALVVGGTNGIGYAMACRVAASSPSGSVIVSGRTKPSLPHANMEFRPIEATSMREIKKYTDAFKASVAQGQDQKLDLLIMTQGILSMAGRTETPEGIDRKLALHYYGRQLLIRELLPVLKEDAKVIMVLDSHRGHPSMLIMDDLDLKTHYSLGNAGAHGMTMQDGMLQQYAAEQEKQGTGRRHFIHCSPGVVHTDIMKGLPGYMRPLAWVGRAILSVPPEKCAENLLNGSAAVAESGEKEGRFWSNIDDKGRLVPGRPVWDVDQREKVAAHTWQLIDSALKA